MSFLLPIIVLCLAINPIVSYELRRRLSWLDDAARSMGIHLAAGRGSGKSRLMGRILAFLDFLRGIPQVILDPVGGTIDNFLDKIIHLPAACQVRLWPRILYIDMSGKLGFVVPFPLYYQLGRESLYESSQRFLNTVRKIDPYLVTASVEGWNALWECGTYAGMLLVALGCQITEAADLIEHPRAWKDRLLGVADQYPETRSAVEFFTQVLPSLKLDQRERKTRSFLNKIRVFSLDPAMKVMFGSSFPSIDWQKVVNNGITVLLDFRHELDLERRRFKMMWAFNSVFDFVKHRGFGRHAPFGLIVDEITALYNFDTQVGSDIFAADLDELINIWARNARIWLTLAHQEQFQLNERMQKTLLGMGTQILGVTGDMESALTQAQEFFRYDPDRVKRWEPVWMSAPLGPFIVDYRPIEFTLDEQQYLAAYLFKDLSRFRFLVRPALGEGDTRGQLRYVSIANLDRGIYPDEKIVAQARYLLAQRSGIPIETLLAEIGGRRQLPAPKSSAKQKLEMKPAAEHAILEAEDEPDGGDRSEFWQERES